MVGSDAEASNDEKLCSEIIEEVSDASSLKQETLRSTYSRALFEYSSSNLCFTPDSYSSELTLVDFLDQLFFTECLLDLLHVPSLSLEHLYCRSVDVLQQ